MSAEIFSGKELAKKIRVGLKAECEAFVRECGRSPGLVVILVGEDPASQVYVRNKETACQKVGFKSIVNRLPADTDEETLLKLIGSYNDDSSIDGILVQLPLPKGLNEKKILEAIRPEKDVDGFHYMNMGRLLAGEPCCARACTPKGVMRILEEAHVELAGKHAVVVGRSNIVGKPLALMLLEKNATVTVCHSKTADLASITRQADVLLVAVGRAEMICGHMIKPGAVVIDVGINRTGDGLKGDVCFEEAVEVASLITPVPGGVGPMTIAMLLENAMEAARRHG